MFGTGKLLSKSPRGEYFRQRLRLCSSVDPRPGVRTNVVLHSPWPGHLQSFRCPPGRVEWYFGPRVHVGGHYDTVSRGKTVHVPSTVGSGIIGCPVLSNVTTGLVGPTVHVRGQWPTVDVSTLFPLFCRTRPFVGTGAGDRWGSDRTDPIVLVSWRP